MNDQVRFALAATGVAFVGFFTCVFVFVFDPTRSFLVVLLIGVPLGLVISLVLWLLKDILGALGPG
jgi:hypothetical protein